MSGVTFVSFVPVEILFGGGCASVAHNYNNKFPHSLFVFGHVSLNGVFLSFSRVGGGGGGVL